MEWWSTPTGNRHALVSAAPNGTIRFRVPDDFAFNRALIRGDRVIVGGSDGVAAHALSDGRRLWSENLVNSSGSTSAAACSSSSGEGLVLAMSLAADGTLAVAWSCNAWRDGTLELIDVSSGAALAVTDTRIGAEHMSLDPGALLRVEFHGYRTDAYTATVGPGGALSDVSQSSYDAAYGGFWAREDVSAGTLVEAFTYADGRTASTIPASRAKVCVVGRETRQLNIALSDHVGFLPEDYSTVDNHSWFQDTRLRGFDPAGRVAPWQLDLGATVFGSSTLTNQDALLFDLGLPDGGFALDEVNASGLSDFVCPYAGRFRQSPGLTMPPAVLAGGMWVSANELPDGGQEIDAYAVPGLDVAAHGWTTCGGSNARAGLPR